MTFLDIVAAQSGKESGNIYYFFNIYYPFDTKVFEKSSRDTIKLLRELYKHYKIGIKEIKPFPHPAGSITMAIIENLKELVERGELIDPELVKLNLLTRDELKAAAELYRMIEEKMNTIPQVNIQNNYKEALRILWNSGLNEYLEIVSIVDGQIRAHPDLKLIETQNDLYIYYLTDEVWYNKPPFDVLEKVLIDIAKSPSHNILVDIRRNDVNHRTITIFKENYNISKLPALVITSEDIVDGLNVKKSDKSLLIPYEILFYLCEYGNEVKIKKFLVELISLLESEKLTSAKIKLYWNRINEIGYKVYKEAWQFVQLLIIEYLRKLGI